MAHGQLLLCSRNTRTRRCDRPPDPRGAGIRRETEKKEAQRVVHSEHDHSSGYRSFRLDFAIDDKTARAKYTDGVLELVLPRKAGSAPNRATVS